MLNIFNIYIEYMLSADVLSLYVFLEKRCFAYLE